MNILPVEKFTLTSRLSPDEVKEKLRAVTGKERAMKISFRFNFDGLGDQPKNTGLYLGSLYGNSFSISRNLNYRNSFQPSIKGEISATSYGTDIHVKMLPEVVVIVFMCIWCGGLMIGFLAILAASVSKGKFDAGIFFPLGMLLFGYLLVKFGFSFEASKSRKDLKEIWEATEKE